MKLIKIFDTSSLDGKVDRSFIIAVQNKNYNEIVDKIAEIIEGESKDKYNDIMTCLRLYDTRIISEEVDETIYW